MAKKFLTSIDLNGNQLIRPIIENVTDNPENDLAKGRLAFNTTSNVPIVYDGASWKNLQYEIPSGTYLTQNEEITLSGIVTGKGRTAITTAIADGALTIAKTKDLQTTLNAKMTTASYPSLTAIQTIGATATPIGFLKKTGASTWTIDTNSYLTENQTITLSGVITGSGRTALTTSIADDALTIAKTKGLQTALNAKMTTASYSNLVAIEAITGTSGFLKKTAANEWSLDTNSYLTSSSSLNAGKLTGTIPTAVLGNSTLYVGTTPIKLNRASGNLALTGITSIELGGSTNVYLKYDSVNNAVYVEKKVGTTITPVNFYATGEVAGFGAGSGLPDGGTGGGASALSSLSDVSLTTATSGNVLMFNGTHWENKPQSEIVPNLSSYASKTYVDTKVAGLVDSAPETLDTLVELAAALGNDENFATTVANEIGTKEDKITAGTTAQYWRGNKTWATLNTNAVPEGTNNKYYTDARVKSYGDTLYLGKTATATAATALATARTFSIGGSTGLTAAGIKFSGADNVALSLTGTLKVANGGTGLTDAKGGFTRKVVGTLTTSSTSYEITHGLGTDVVVQVVEVASKEVVECDIIMTSTTIATIKFNKPPAANAYRYIIVG